MIDITKKAYRIAKMQLEERMLVYFEKCNEIEEKYDYDDDQFDRICDEQEILREHLEIHDIEVEVMVLEEKLIKWFKLVTIENDQFNELSASMGMTKEEIKDVLENGVKISKARSRIIDMIMKYEG